MSTAQAIESQTVADNGHADAHGHADDGALHPHVVPVSLLFIVYGILVLATIATVAVTLVDLGQLNITVALAIAVFKAALVILYFMHLRWDNLFNGVVLISALAFVFLFIAVALMDTGEYKVNDQPPGTRQMMSSQNGL
jgi:cytochrome c oxidase subunit 4